MRPTDKAVSDPIVYGNVHDVATDRIREMIISGQFKSGDRLRQDELAATLGVSTMPIREALRRLQAEGLVAFYPRRGATVAQLTRSEFEELFRIREELECLAFRWAAEDFSRIPIARLRRVLADLEETEAQLDVPRRLHLVREFFFAIFEASEKPYLLRLLSSLWDVSQQYRRSFSVIAEVVPVRLEHYRNIYRACEAHDSEALIRGFRELYAFVSVTLIPRLRGGEGENQGQ